MTDERLRRLPAVIAAVGARVPVARFPVLGIVDLAIGCPPPPGAAAPSSRAGAARPTSER